jgi:AcrR family transcriptional regulator
LTASILFVGGDWHGAWVNPFLRPDAADEAEMLTDAAHAVVLEHGLGGLSIRAIARQIGVTGPALTQRWGGAGSARDRILRVVVRTFGERWTQWSRWPLIDVQPALSLPMTDDEVAGVRTWLALDALARGEAAAGNSDLAVIVAEIQAAERREVEYMVRGGDGERLGAEAAAGICVVAAGLRAELVVSAPALDVESARRLLHSHVEHVRSGGRCALAN